MLYILHCVNNNTRINITLMVRRCDIPHAVAVVLFSARLCQVRKFLQAGATGLRSDVRHGDNMDCPLSAVTQDTLCAAGLGQQRTEGLAPVSQQRRSSRIQF